ncbi:MAG: hypothetical protein D3911_02715 [Candidatus Electrothrix sp. AW3_4]|nr:hypothetical protein [Candidatus Electrothrix gigas]
MKSIDQFSFLHSQFHDLCGIMLDARPPSIAATSFNMTVFCIIIYVGNKFPAIQSKTGQLVRRGYILIHSCKIGLFFWSDKSNKQAGVNSNIEIFFCINTM